MPGWTVWAAVHPVINGGVHTVVVGAGVVINVGTKVVKTVGAIVGATVEVKIVVGAAVTPLKQIQSPGWSELQFV